jgi:hypothetical protein
MNAHGAASTKMKVEAERSMHAVKVCIDKPRRRDRSGAAHRDTLEISEQLAAPAYAR